MGLDMYLEADKWIGGHYEFKDAQGSVDISLRVNDETREDIHFDAKEVQSITTNVGYWRKANAIHKWFVDNVQEGNDNCQRSWVAPEMLETLKLQCEAVLANPDQAAELLPSQSGFFFGGTDYDEWYINDLKETIKIIDKALAMKGFDFYYQASW